MKKTIALCSALLVSGAAFAADEAPAPVTESSYAVTLDFPYVTNYVFRGQEIARSSLQPSVEIAYDGFYAGVWSNVPLRKEHDGDVSKEIDLYAGWTPKLTDNLSADVGLTYYWYPWLDGTGNDDSIEAFGGLNLTLGNITPAVYVYRDLDLDVTTVQTSVGYSLPLTTLGTSLDFNATFGAVFPDDGEKYCYYSAGVSLPYKLSDSLKLTLGVTYTENDLDHGKDPAAWGLASLTYTFN
ncbi:MAG TPA: TorF family putative porin [Opitutaceae bacterium]|nr:TorF family putative porin [Opitutaceae bacterium]